MFAYLYIIEQTTKNLIFEKDIE